MTPPARRALDLLPNLLAAVLAVLIGWAYWAFSYDDAFITYRYAHNWAERGALEYNPGEGVLGTTAPGYALALGALARMTALDVAGLGTMASLLSLVALVTWTSRQLAGWASTPRYAIPATFALLALTSQWNVEMLGAEAFPIVALGAWAATVALEGEASPRRQLVAGILVALAMSFRLDAAVLAGLVGVVLWQRERRLPWIYGLAGGLPLLGWLGWLDRTFGAFVPATLAAKQSESELVALQSYGAQQWRWLARTLPGVATPLLVVLATSAVVVLVVRRRRGPLPTSAAIVVGLWALAHEVAYRILGVPFAPWYSLLSLQLLFLLAVAGALLIAEEVARRTSGRLAPARILAAVVAVALLLPVALPGIGYAVRHRFRPPDPRYPSYHRVASELAARADDVATVASIEIGVLGYFAPSRVLDLSGLVTPGVVAARRAGELPALVAARAPDFIVASDAFPEQTLPILAAPGIAGRYREVLAIQHGDVRHWRMRLLERVSPAP